MSSCATNCRPRQTHDCFATKPHKNRSPSDTADLRAHTWIDDDDPFWRDPRGTLPVSTSHLAFHTVTEEREASTGGKLFRRAYALINIEGQLQPGPLPHLNQKYPFIETGFSAVARAALPSFFPAVFRWELQPIPLDSEMVLNSMVYGIR